MRLTALLLLSSLMTACGNAALGACPLLTDWHFNDAERSALTYEHKVKLKDQKDYYEAHCD